MPVKISVICATLGRSELQRLVSSLKAQTLPRSDWELLIIQKADEMNEYEARNRAALRAKGEVFCFMDDDTYVDPDYLQKGLSHFFSTGPGVMDCPFILGGSKIDKKFWGTGCTLWSNRLAFEALNGFEVSWGLPGIVRGWRSDTDFLWRALDKFGEGSYVHATDIVVYHPEPMKSQFDAKVEKVFYLRHVDRCMEMFLPVDTRMPSIVMAIDPSEEHRERAKKQQDEFIEKGFLTAMVAEAQNKQIAEQML